MRASSPWPSTQLRRRCGLAGAAPSTLRTPAERGAAAGHGAGQREGGGHADGAGDGMRGMAAARREVARGDAVGVVARAHEHRLGDHAVRRHRPGPSRSPAGAAQRFQAVQQRRGWHRARPASRGRSGPRSAARTIISGMAASMQVTSTPSMTSMRWPVGNTEPVTAPQASRKFSRIGAAVPATPSMRGVAVVGDAAARGAAP